MTAPLHSRIVLVTDISDKVVNHVVHDLLDAMAVQFKFSLHAQRKHDQAIWPHLNITLAVDGKKMLFEPYRLVLDREVNTSLVLKSDDRMDEIMFIALQNVSITSGWDEQYTGYTWAPRSRALYCRPDKSDSERSLKQFYHLPDSELLHYFDL